MSHPPITNPSSVRTARGARLPLPPSFDERPRTEQILAVVVGPIVFGVVAGLMIGWSAVAYWAWVGTGMVLGLPAALEHDRPRDGARRGATVGALYACGLLLTHAATSARALVSLPHPSVSLILVAGLLVAGMDAAGAACRRAVLRARTR
jgi:hypothetical protein